MWQTGLTEQSQCHAVSASLGSWFLEIHPIHLTNCLAFFFFFFFLREVYKKNQYGPESISPYPTRTAPCVDVTRLTYEVLFLYRLIKQVASR